MSQTKHENEQLEFWRGNFGSGYIERNLATAQHLRARVALWARILKSLDGSPPTSILEVGANIGNNLRALQTLTGAAMFAVEPNALARDKLVSEKVVPAENAMDGIAAKIPLSNDAVDLSFTSGVLIHIHPNDLLPSCAEVYRVTRRYIVCIEYFSDKPESIPYRGQTDKLFKRDFGGFWLDNFPNLLLLDYGFTWKRITGLDNLTWWLFEKRH